MHHERLQTARLEWDENGVPRSVDYGDIYFSPHDGVAETRYVFIQGNALERRFAALRDGQQIVVAETGFGSGLNFLCTSSLFLESSTGMTRLHFVSVEIHPFDRQDMQRLRGSLPPSLHPMADELLAAYPLLVRGLHRLVLAGGRVHLSLYFGDVLQGLQALSFRADAWFLDGFAPAVNPAMWGETLCAAIAAHSRSGTTLATFTAAGSVRRALTEAGFHVTRSKGFGRKRHMTQAVFTSTASDGNRLPIGTFSLQGGMESTDPPSSRQRIIIIGSGLAGACMAFNARQLGAELLVLEAEPDVACGGSGNAQGALYIKPGLEWSAHTRLQVAAALHARQFYASVPELAASCWKECGLLVQISDAREETRQARLNELNDYPPEFFHSLTRDQASSRAEVALARGGLFFPSGGWLNPRAACRLLLQHSGARILCSRRVQAISGNASSLLVHTTEEDFAADHVVLATAHWPAIPLPIDPLLTAPPCKPISGQITQFRPGPGSGPLACVVCGDGYLLPVVNSLQWTGASFRLKSAATDLREEDDLDNLKKAARLLAPSAEQAISQGITASRAAVRHTLPDYFPLAGPVTLPAAAAGRLWCIGGLGSKGIALAPLLAQYVTDRIGGAPWAVEQDLAARLHPGRFTARTRS